MTALTARCFVDDNYVITFRGDLTEEELAELSDLAHQAFNQGLRSGFMQGYELAVEHGRAA